MFASSCKRAIIDCLRQHHLHKRQQQSACDVTRRGSAVDISPTSGADYNHNDDDSRSNNTDTASETSCASPRDCSDTSTTTSTTAGDRRRRRCYTRCSSLRCPSHVPGAYHGGRRREQPPAVFNSLAERRAWERERLKKDNHNTSNHITCF